MENTALSQAHQDTQTTFISPGTSIEGIIHSNGNIILEGEATGEIVASGMLTISSAYNGTAAARAIYLKGAKMEGDVVVSESLSVDGQSELKRNGRIGSLHCDGCIEGNMKVAAEAVVGKRAVLKGDLAAAYLTIERGAKMTGRVDVTGEPGK
ncbi:MAG: polymer-forming cytoskeletal protein [Treponema sp.]|nr:polymer-forming cytoskeletal protein [Treponema sp.]